MSAYISILRGINVSGHRLIKMNDLKALCQELGFRQIQTYIQSGNIVFQYRKTDPVKISARLKDALMKQFGFEVPVITFLEEELDKIIQANPFVGDPSINPKYLHITFLSDKPEQAVSDQLARTGYGQDRLALVGRSIYLYCPGGYGVSQLTNSFFERRLAVTATTRNWKTALTLLRLVRELKDDRPLANR